MPIAGQIGSSQSTSDGALQMPCAAAGLNTITLAPKWTHSIGAEILILARCKPLWDHSDAFSYQCHFSTAALRMVGLYLARLYHWDSKQGAAPQRWISYCSSYQSDLHNSPQPEIMYVVLWHLRWSILVALINISESSIRKVDVITGLPWPEKLLISARQIGSKSGSLFAALSAWFTLQEIAWRRNQPNLTPFKDSVYVSLGTALIRQCADSIVFPAWDGSGILQLVGTR